jgi:hypothetical protein
MQRVEASYRRLKQLVHRHLPVHRAIAEVLRIHGDLYARVREAEERARGRLS